MSLRTLGLQSTFSRFFKGGETDTVVRAVLTVLDFKRFPQESLDNIITRCDQEIGGYSTVAVDYVPETQTGRFTGYLNLDLPKDNPEITRSGYAMFRTKDQKESWLVGDRFWDWSQFSSLVLRVRGDRRKYLVNIQANTPLITDLFQHRLFLNTPGEWETVVIPLNDFVMTNWGVIQDGCELNKNEVKTFGIGLLDKQYGPFNLDIDWVKVMTGVEVERLANKNRKTAMGLQGSETATSDAATAAAAATSSISTEGPEFELEDDSYEHGAAIPSRMPHEPHNKVI
ncbi:uncharacterized protein KQ657_004976 [Scheffersomyces spartinae]|uniref:NADH:ubiquinone oxidoreductase intermediate-associated protein 30 domain-containing protein n=1 Tax=Scheffersomyces spartinae TaxID=45513 RepID=A0A9P7VAZ9_9ASCO|nr:uncharacterized protein KQ657_004976 [Scheffersomyces spartinae]KAG7194256.1 hypothetical protein KQ657_004976 [Scheffersomyces spartinae]